MKKVLAALLAVLLLTCVFATVAMAAGNMELGHWWSIKYDSLDILKLFPKKGTEHNQRNITLTVDESDKLFKDFGWDKTKWLNYVESNYSAKIGNVDRQPKWSYECDGGHWEDVSKSDTELKFKWYCDATNGREQHKIYVTINLPAKHTHTPGEWVTTKEPTCTEKGEQVKKCTTCEEVLGTEEIPALDHDWDEGTVTTEPTCTKPGVKTFTCKNDNSHVKTETLEVDANAHPAGEPKNCTKADDKEHKFTCSACGAEIGTREVHSFTVEIERVNPTIQEKGYVVYQCSKCEATKRDELDKKTCDHYDDIDYYEPKEATCVEAGNLEYYYCHDCDKVLVCDENDELVETTLEAVILQRNNNHNEGLWYDVKKPTCLEPGEMQRWCTRQTKEGTLCHAVLESKPTDAFGHDFGNWYSISDKQHEHKCSRCEATENDNHHFDNGVDATNENGERGKKYTCTDCGYWYFVANEPVVTGEPTAKPTAKPTEKPTEAPTTAPTEEPTAEPTAEPTEEPTTAPTEEPTAEPTTEPTAEPSAEPSVEPSTEPTKKPGGTKIPKTGDNSHFGYAYLMIAVAAAGLCVLAATRRKEGSK